MMADLCTNETAAKIAAALGAVHPRNVTAARVHRLDNEGDTYLLIQFDTDDAQMAVAAVDPNDGDLLSAVKLSQGARHELLTEADAVRISGHEMGPHVTRLVWKPCSATYSLLYPIWEIQSQSGKSFVTQDGKVLSKLEERSKRG